MEASSGYKISPPILALCFHAGRILGDLKDCYLCNDYVVHKFCGRVVTGNSSSNISFLLISSFSKPNQTNNRILRHTSEMS